MKSESKKKIQTISDAQKEIERQREEIAKSRKDGTFNAEKHLEKQPMVKALKAGAFKDLKHG